MKKYRSSTCFYNMGWSKQRSRRRKQRRCPCLCVCWRAVVFAACCHQVTSDMSVTSHQQLWHTHNSLSISAGETVSRQMPHEKCLCVCGWKQLLKTSGKFMLRSRVQAWRWEMMKKPEDSANNEWLQCTKSPALRDCRRPPGGKIKSILTLFKFTNTKSCQPSDDQQCFQLY